MQRFKIREDHIGVFENYVDDRLIDKYLKEYDYAEAQGIVLPRKKDEFHITADHSVDRISSHFYLGLNYTNRPFIDFFFTKIYPLYTQHYSLLKQTSRHTIFDMKLQKTCPGEGYHNWHVEHDRMGNRNRLMAFMVYLNDVEEGGETEFLYQKCRFKPKRNTLLLWPANYTHAHRGNPPLSNDKFILTGWVEYGG